VVASDFVMYAFDRLLVFINKIRIHHFDAEAGLPILKIIKNRSTYILETEIQTYMLS
jgi:hypothetical protein